MATIFRLATPMDADSIMKIYRPYVEYTTVSSEYVVPPKNEFEQRIIDISSVFPFVLCVIDGEIAGYGYASKKQERAAYSWRADLSIYIDENFHRMGIATAIYNAVLELLAKQGYYNAYAVVTSPNEKSEHFHESLGFIKIGYYNNTGYKHGEWRNVSVYEKCLRKHVGEPLPTKSIEELDKEYVAKVLTKWQHTVTERQCIYEF